MAQNTSLVPLAGMMETTTILRAALASDAFSLDGSNVLEMSVHQRWTMG